MEHMHDVMIKWNANLSRISLLFLLCFFIGINQVIGEGLINLSDKNLTLWYDQPAKDWMTEALPIGNGYMGAMFFGGIEKEQIQFTEGSLWSGGPGAHEDYNFGNREGAWKHLEEVRTLLSESKFKEAQLRTLIFICFKR
jgi:hypothetical protein